MEKKLIRRCIKGDREAQTELYRVFSGKMFALCYRYASNYHTAQDILQEGFVKVFTHLEKFEGRGSLEGWIRKIIVNTALETLRKKSPTDHFQEIETAPEKGIPDGIVEDIETQVLMDMIQDLPDGYREVFNMYVVEGYSHQEISQLTHITESNSKIRLMRARQMLQTKILEANQVKNEHVGLPHV